MHRPIHFEIQAGEPQRAIKFYSGLFGWTFEQWGSNEYWMLSTAPKESKDMGINGGLMPRKGPAPKDGEGMSGYVCTIDVADVDAKVAEVIAAGGALAVPKVAIPGMAWLAYCKDTEGNMFGLFQLDKDAK